MRPKFNGSKGRIPDLRVTPVIFRFSAKAAKPLPASKRLLCAANQTPMFELNHAAMNESLEHGIGG